jgi:hypothetical protein
MSERNSINRTLAVRFYRIAGSSHGYFATGGMALLALGVVGLMDEATAAATLAAAFTLGGLLLAAAAVITRNSNEPCKCRVEHGQVRVRPARHC